jgi:predicted membrane GTPase involved in stress response
MEREDALAARKAELTEMSRFLAGTMRSRWKTPASIGIGVAGAVWTLRTGDPLGAIFGAAAAIVGEAAEEARPADAYSYVLNTRQIHG